MKITFYSHPPTFDVTAYAETGDVLARNSNYFSKYLDDDTIELLIGEKGLYEFYDGKNEFDIPDWKIELIKNKRIAKTNKEIEFFTAWNN